MHSRKIAHRDLKLGNVMVTNYDTDDERDICLYVIDFGLAKIFMKDNHELKMNSFKGTETFLAPEIIKLYNET